MWEAISGRSIVCLSCYYTLFHKDLIVKTVGSGTACRQSVGLSIALCSYFVSRMVVFFFFSEALATEKEMIMRGSISEQSTSCYLS